MQQSKPERQLPIWLLAYGVVYVAVGMAIHVAGYPIGNVGVESDFYAEMAPAAREISEGHFSLDLFPYKGPLYALLLVPVQAVAGDWYRSGVVLNLACAAISILLGFLMVRRVSNERVAGFAVVLASLTYPFFIDAHKATSDHLCLLLLVASSVCLFRSDRGRHWVPLAGFLAGLAFLTRYNAAFFVAGSFAFLLWVSPHSSRVRSRLGSLGLFAAGWGLVALPWIIWFLVETGAGPWARNVHNVKLAFPDLVAHLPAGETAPSIGNLIMQDPLGFLIAYTQNLAGHLWKDLRHLIRPLGATFVIAGALRYAFYKPTRFQIGLILLTLAHGAGLGLVFYLPRFSTFGLFVLYAIAGCLVLGNPSAELTSWGRRVKAWLGSRQGSLFEAARHLGNPGSAGRRIAGSLILVLLVAYNAHAVFLLERTYWRDRPLYLMRAAEVLRGSRSARPVSTALPPKLMARKPHLAFLAEMDYQRFPDEVASLNALLAAMRTGQVGYLLFSQGARRDFPQLRYLAFLRSIPGLKTILACSEYTLFSLDERPPNLGQWDDALALKRSNIQEALLVGDDQAASQWSTSVTTGLVERGEVTVAVQVLQETLDAWEGRRAIEGREGIRAPEDPRPKALVRLRLALLESQRGMSARAIELLEQNRRDLAVLPAGEGLHEKATTLSVLGYQRQKSGDSQAALVCFLKARSMFQSAGDAAAVGSLDEQIRRLGSEAR